MVPVVLDSVANVVNARADVSLVMDRGPLLAVRLDTARLPPPTVRLKAPPALPVTDPVRVACVTETEPVLLFKDMPFVPCRVPPPVTVNPLAPLSERA